MLCSMLPTASPHPGSRYGKDWEEKAVRCVCDNAAVVAIIRSGSSKNERVAQLIHSLVLFMAEFHITLVGEHIPGVDMSGRFPNKKQSPTFSVTGAIGSERTIPSQRRLPSGAGSSETRLDSKEVDNLAMKYLTRGLAASTRRSYNSAQNRYLKFCRELGYVAVPATEIGLCHYISRG